MSDPDLPSPRAPARPRLGDQLRDLAARLNAWLDQLRPTPAPRLVPVPVRARSPRR